MPKTTIKHTGRSFSKGHNKLLDYLVDQKISINAVCGGRGRCGLCRARIVKPKSPNEIDTLLIDPKLLKKGYRLACQYPIDDGLEVIVPKTKIVRYSSRTPKRFGLALDLGTSTIKAAVVDLKSGKTTKKTTVFNPQNSLGGDVMTRIGAAGEGNYKKLREQLLFGIEIAKERLRIPKPIFTIVVGNPVMLSFYLNKSVAGLSRYPFKSEIKEGKFLKNPPRYVFPIIGGFVGGDAIAGIIASNIGHREGIFLYIDLGTNGEIAVIKKDKIIVLSAAAGPAFEGVGISRGSLAIPGAIDRISYNRGFRFSTIDDKKPIGFCASGLIDLIAILLSHGWLQEDGRLVRKVKINGLGITQDDIRKLQLATGAIHTGIEVLLQKAGVKPSEVDEAILTGEFGSSLNSKSLRRIGILQNGIKKIRLKNDLPLQGALKVLLDNAALEQVRRIEKMSEHLELASEPDFQKKFVSNLKLAPW